MNEYENNRDEYCPECPHPYRGFGFELSDESSELFPIYSPAYSMQADIDSLQAGIPNAQIFNVCWDEKGKLGTGACSIPTTLPAVKAGTVIDIKADIANSGTTGRVMVIFKIDGVSKYTDTNVSLGTYPGGGLWSPVYSGFTMPTKNVTLAVEAHNWDGTKWVLSSSKSFTISMTSAGCTGIDLVPFSASIKQGEKVDMIVAVSPGNVPFTVTFKDRVGTVLGTCKTSGMGTATGASTCFFTWDSNSWGKAPGIYYIKAYANSCMSTESVIQVSVAMRQWNFAVTVKDSKTGLVVQGATVLASTVGKASQSKITDANGQVSFRIDEGTINVSISKDKYNTFDTVEYLFMDRTVTYSIDPTPPTPTTGNIEFVSVPVGAEIFIDGKTTNQKTPVIITDIQSGEHTWELRFPEYNSSSGKVIVPSGSTISVYTTLTKSTPTAGSLNITSTPMGADVWIDGKDMGVTTSGATIITDIPPGEHSLTLTMIGHQDHAATFNITAGKTTYLDVELIPLETIGVLEISSEPSGARVYIDDKDTERNTPATITNLVAGDHSYILKLSGHKDVTGIVSIIAKETKTVHIILEKTGIPGAELLAAGAAAVAIIAFATRKRET